jgi:hypothetical protein
MTLTIGPRPLGSTGPRTVNYRIDGPKHRLLLRAGQSVGDSAHQGERVRWDVWLVILSVLQFAVGDPARPTLTPSSALPTTCLPRFVPLSLTTVQRTSDIRADECGH